MKRRVALTLLAVLFVSAASGCACETGTEPFPTSGAVPSEPATVPEESKATEQPTEATTDVPTPEGLPPLPPDPQQVEFQAEDGQVLVGTYYPAAVNPAPLVVLMHWSRGNESDWVAIAAWLQNRGREVEPGDTPWLMPGWFPPMLEGQSFAVFAFTFRGCEGACSSSLDREGRLLDAKAAMRTAGELDGVDPQRLAAIGASIGSDGAVDACGEGCLGALSLSPGSYLTVDYAEAVAAVDGAGKPAWCLAAERDQDSAQACESASGDHYRMEIYPGSDHGMQLIKPDAEPNTLELILEFLRLVFEIE
jgi:dienelactone hydrolase